MILVCTIEIKDNILVPKSLSEKKKGGKYKGKKEGGVAIIKNKNNNKINSYSFT